MAKFSIITWNRNHSEKKWWSSDYAKKWIILCIKRKENKHCSVEHGGPCVRILWGDQGGLWYSLFSFCLVHHEGSSLAPREKAAKLRWTNKHSYQSRMVWVRNGERNHLDSCISSHQVPFSDVGQQNSWGVQGAELFLALCPRKGISLAFNE